MKDMEVFPISTLGEQIRSLRKERGMTLEALAGNELTKGMLSLIENNKANPSIDSLNYIAQQLQVEVSMLLQDENVQELRALLEQVEKIYMLDVDVGNEKQKNNKYRQLKHLIDPVINRLGEGYESSRLLEIYGYSIYHLSRNDNWKSYLERAAQMYEKMNLVDRKASISIFLTNTMVKRHEYKMALEFLLSERKYLEKLYPFLSPLTQLDFDYHEAVLYFAIGDSDAANQIIERAIHFSKKHQVFYHIDDLYRISVAYGLLFQDEEKLNIYLKKLMEYAAFVDDSLYKIFIDYVEAEAYLFNKQDYGRAIQIVEQHLSIPEDLGTLYPYFIITKGKALYGLGRYEEAIKWLSDVKIPDYSPHPFDLTTFYIADSYLARCYDKLGQVDKAVKFATRAKERITPFPETFYKKFIIETYNEIVQAIV
ncbi:helix-turn-helix domain-containing protein [Bacillus andreraoultii]|uniref:helix-turn-helix domain-containing protein n=1 Tax=Bacillus andreraoultii TaxID=1499685 RepID=UPI0009E6046C|nr:helix-turn-helix transcriptional regulator [Bacillus andreraoultii]